MPKKNRLTELEELQDAASKGKLSKEGASRLDLLLAEREAESNNSDSSTREGRNKAEGEPKKGGSDKDKGAPEKPDPAGQAAEEECCCEKIVVLLESIKVVTLTSPRTFKDDVVVTAVTTGEVMAPNPQPFAWPLDRNKKIKAAVMDTGEMESPGVTIASVRPGQDCRFQLSCRVDFWEEDAERLGQLLDESVRKLIFDMSQASGVAVPTPGIDLIYEVVRLIMEKLDLSDDRMGTLNFELAGKMDCHTPLKDMSWVPELSTTRAFQHEVLSKDSIRLTKSLRRFGGVWEVAMIVQRVCPK